MADTAALALPQLMQLIDAQLRGCSPTDRSGYALMVLRLEHFRDIQETLGFGSAEDVVRILGTRFATTPGMIAHGRLHNNVLVCFMSLSDAMMLQALEVAARMEQPVPVGAFDVPVSVTIGAADGPSHGSTAELLLLSAENALSAAKPGTIELCNDARDEAQRMRSAIARHMKEELEGGRFELAYQPIYRLSDRRVVATEAFVRWPPEHPLFIDPLDFIPVAETSGDIIALGDFVLERACSQYVKWRNRRISTGFLALNISPVQLTDGDAIMRIHRTVTRHGLMPGQVELEISLKGLRKNRERTLNLLGELQTLGFRIVIDDFGSVDGALAVMEQLPADVLKLHGDYVAAHTSVAHKRKIMQGVLNLARNIGMITCAEGVETAEQLSVLTELGCDQAQGNFFAPPGDAEATERALVGPSRLAAEGMVF